MEQRQLTLFPLPETANLTCDPRQLYRDDSAYITPLSKIDSPKDYQVNKIPVGESKTEDQKNFGESNKKPFTRIYKPAGTARTSNEYFALNYKDKSGKWKDKHICGGNINQSSAIKRREAIDKAIAQNTPIKKLLEMCK